MDIPSLTQKQTTPKVSDINFSVTTIIVVVVLSVVSGFWLSRFFPKNQTALMETPSANTKTITTDNISSPDDIKPGKVYGNSEKNFKDAATGTIEKGSINGEGTHILNREGGPTQRASLISSTVDLDLFIGKKVEVKGETNASNKTSWLLDVGNLKVIE